MSKINQEEYETLKKKQEKGHKYIAREKEGHVIVFTDYHGKSEYRWLVTINEDNLKYESLFNSSKVFQFIQWEDESPYNIQELIEEYLYNNRPKLFIDGQEQSFEFIEESEEKEVKDLEWLKRSIDKRIKTIESDDITFVGSEYYDEGYIDGMRDVLYRINQLDEPEVLSQEWLDEHLFSLGDKYPWKEAVPVVDLQNLLVPKRERLTIPNYVAKWISRHHEQFDLYPALKRLENNMSSWENVYEWYRENTRNFVNAYLTGEYEIEQEPKYYAKIKGHENIGSNDKYWNYNTDMEELSIGDSEVHPNVISEYTIKATKDEWANLGINDDNAEFVKVEEEEE